MSRASRPHIIIYTLISCSHFTATIYYFPFQPNKTNQISWPKRRRYSGFDWFVKAVMKDAVCRQTWLRISCCNEPSGTSVSMVQTRKSAPPYVLCWKVKVSYVVTDTRALDAQPSRPVFGSRQASPLWPNRLRNQRNSSRKMSCWVICSSAKCAPVGIWFPDPRTCFL